MKVNRLSQGRGIKTDKFYAVFMFRDRKCRVPLSTNERASRAAAAKVDDLVNYRQANAALPPELSRWVEQMDSCMRDSLTLYGVIAGTVAAASKPMSAHLADWKAALRAKGNTVDYVELKISRVTDTLDACGFRYWTDINASKLLTGPHFECHAEV